MRTCVYPGTFDPATNGHLDVIARAERLFDRVVVGVACNLEKEPLFTPEKRVLLLQENLNGHPRVTVEKFDGLLMDFANRYDAVAVVRGLRAVSDFEYEFQMALMNRHLESEIETIFLMPHESYIYTSSRMVKQVSKYGGDVSAFVPPNVRQALSEQFSATTC